MDLLAFHQMMLVFESVILDRRYEILPTSNYLFDFRKKHLTPEYTWFLKATLNINTNNLELYGTTFYIKLDSLTRNV